jgi:hypothetical protein
MATPPTPTLGELAYTAYWRVLAPLWLPWDRLTRQERRAWEACARAAIRSWDSASVQVVARLVEGRD